MKKIIFNIVLAVIVNCFATNAQEATEEEPTKMQKVVMAHDELMAKMPEMVKLIGKLESEAASAEDAQKYVDAIKALKKANKSMMDWMQGFGQDFDADEMFKGKSLSEQKTKWLDKREVELKTMQEQINRSIGIGRSLLPKE